MKNLQFKWRYIFSLKIVLLQRWLSVSAETLENNSTRFIRVSSFKSTTGFFIWKNLVEQ